MKELSNNNRRFLKLYEEHRDLDARVKKLEKRKNLTSLDTEEMKKMKILKLKLKDEMQRITQSRPCEKTLDKSV